MLTKLLTLTAFVAAFGHVFFRPKLKQLGRRIDHVVTVTAVVVVIVWLGEVGYVLFVRR